MTQCKINSKNPIIQMVYNTKTTKQSCATSCFYDDSIPQNTEGDEILAVTITPKRTSSILEIKFCGNLCPRTAKTNFVVALFQDDIANALCCKMSNPGGGRSQTGTIIYYMTAGTTSATTFKIRGGSTDGNALTVNGAWGDSQIFNGKCSTTLSVTEYFS